jgi:DNA replication initiation complex subunit (GINS family)
MLQNKYDIKQAVKACLISYLEVKYNEAVEQACFSAEISEEVILLRTLKDVYPLLNERLNKLINTIIDEAAWSVPQEIRNLTPEQEKLVDTIVDNSTNNDILLLVNDCKNLLAI